MELLQLKYFKTVAEIGKISAAAEALYISAPALSNSISRLEKELGVQLFDRFAKRIELNSQGEIFLRYVNQMFDALECGKKELLQNAMQQKKHIWIATTTTNLWMDLITEFSQECPQYTLSCTNLNLDKRSFGFLSAQYAFILAEEADIPASFADDLESVLLFEDRPVVMVHPKHPFAGRSSVGINELSEQTLFLPMSGTAQYERFVKLFDANGVAFPNATSCSYQFYRNLVEEQMGVAFSTERIGRNDRSDIRYIPIDNICPPWKMKLYWHKRPLTQDETVFKSFAKEFYHI
ncbi:MAG: LysR family transcriptional regulator [Clostridia bacterium]|nr:LysR family transcriptional regulator [Clostridia bacterium]